MVVRLNNQNLPTTTTRRNNDRHQMQQQQQQQQPPRKILPVGQLKLFFLVVLGTSMVIFQLFTSGMGLSNLQRSTISTPTVTTDPTITTTTTTTTTTHTQHMPLNKKKLPNQPKYLVQIGANDGSSSGNDRLVRDMLVNNNTHAILVEGNPAVFPILLQNIKKMYDYDNNNVDNNRIIPLNVLVCDEDEAVNKTFHVVDTNKLSKLFPNPPHWVLYQISSLERSSTQNGLNFWLSKPNQQRVVNIHNVTVDDFIVQQQIPCTSFDNVLRLGGFVSYEIDVLAVDVEGYDGHVILSALQVPDFQPDTIIFEQKSAKHLFPTIFDSVIQELHKRGYQTGCTRINASASASGGGGGGDGDGSKFVCPTSDDIVAALIT